MRLEKTIKSSNDVPVAPKTPVIRSIAKTGETVEGTKESVEKPKQCTYNECHHTPDQHGIPEAAIQSVISPSKKTGNKLAMMMIIILVVVESAFIFVDSGLLYHWMNEGQVFVEEMVKTMSIVANGFMNDIMHFVKHFSTQIEVFESSMTEIVASVHAMVAIVRDTMMTSSPQRKMTSEPESFDISHNNNSWDFAGQVDGASFSEKADVSGTQHSVIDDLIQDATPTGVSVGYDHDVPLVLAACTVLLVVVPIFVRMMASKVHDRKDVDVHESNKQWYRAANGRLYSQD